MVLTVDKLIAAGNLLTHLSPVAMPRIVFTVAALREGSYRLFPESRHRSKRIKKKLIKHYGGEFRKVPCMYRIGDVIYAHPDFKQRIEANLPLRENNASAPGLW